MKKTLSLILVIALLLALLAPVSADWSSENEKPVATLTIEGTEGEVNFDQNMLKPGDTFYAVLTISGLNIYWSSLQYKLKYDGSKFTLNDVVLSGGKRTLNYKSACGDINNIFGRPTSNLSETETEESFVSVSVATSELTDLEYGDYLKQGSSTELGDIVALKAKFTVNDDVTGRADFSIYTQDTRTDAELTPFQIGFTANSGYSTVTTSTDDLRETVNVVEPNSIVITGDDTINAPLATSEDGWPKDQTIEAQYGATVFGSNGVIENPTVTWNISGSGDKVAIDSGTGKVTIKSSAAAGEYTITATASKENNSSLEENAVGTKTIRVAKEASVPSRIKGKDPAAPAGPYVVPADGENAVTEQFSIYVWDQYGVEMENPQVKWVLNPSNVLGVSLSDDGLLTITNEAKASIDTNGIKFTINAYCGELGPVSTDVTVKRATPVGSSVEILKDGEVIDTDVIAAGESSTYTAAYYDQYGDWIDPPAVTPEWKLESDSVEYFTLAAPSSTAQVTVTNNAENGAIATLNYINEQDKFYDSITITVGALWLKGDVSIQNATYGMTWDDIIDTSKLEAYFGDSKSGKR